MSGKVIVIDGLDGVGKATQVDLLHDRLLKNNVNDGKIIKLSFPNYSSKSSLLVKEYLAGNIYKGAKGVGTLKAIAMLYSIDRHATWYSYKNDQRLLRMIDFYDKGYLFICNRYTSSNIIYLTTQLKEHYIKTETSEFFIDMSMDGLATGILETEHEYLEIPEADNLFILMADPKISHSLLIDRYQKNSGKCDVNENLEFQSKVHETIIQLREDKFFDEDNCKFIECSYRGKMSSIKTIHEKLYKKVCEVL
jgi:dTMP kinase